MSFMKAYAGIIGAWLVATAVSGIWTLPVSAAVVPLLYYDLEDGSGTSITNQGSIAVNGTLGGTSFVVDGDERWVAGPSAVTHSGSAGALLFDGAQRPAGDWINTGISTTNLGIAGAGASYTAAAWINASAWGNTLGHASGDAMIFGSESGGNWLHLGFRNDRAHQGHYGNDQTTSTGYAINTWYHVAYTYNGYEQRIYINGVPVTVGINKGPMTNTSNLIIGNVVGDNRGFQGTIDDVVVYGDVLNPTQIKQLASGTTSPLSLTDFETDPGALTGVPLGGAGTWGVREVIGAGNMTGLSDARAAVTGVSGTVVDLQRSTINIQDSDGGGRYGANQRYEVVEQAHAAYGAVDNLAMVASGRIDIRPGMGGDWTFHVNSDDGFELAIRDINTGNIIPFKGSAGQIAASGNAMTHINDYGALRVGTGRGTDDSLGIVNLPEGQYDVQLLYWEGTGGSAVELSAAWGAKTGWNSGDFSLIGRPGLNAQKLAIAVYTDATKTQSGFDSVTIRDGGAANLAATATQVRGHWDGSAPATNYVASILNSVNLTDPNGGGGGHGQSQTAFPGDTGANDENYTFGARGVLAIAEAGYYTFNTLADDNVQFRLVGSSAWVGNGSAQLLSDGYFSTASGQDAFGTVQLTPGDYEFELLFREGTGNSYLGLWATYSTEGAVYAFDPNVFQLLGGTTNGPSTFTGAVQLVAVPEPGSLALLGMALGLAGVYFARRRQS